MSRYSVAAVLLCAYAGAAAWVVGGEGRSYRESLRLERRAARVGSSPAPAPLAATNPDPAPPAPRAEPPRRAPDPPAPAPAPPVPSNPPAVVAPRPTPPAAVAVAVAPAPARKPDPFWDRPDLNEVWDLDHFKAEDEPRLGAALHDLILQLHKRYDEGPYLRRVEDAAKEILPACARKQVEYTFTILDSDGVNIFSHPGGYIYISRGLFDLIGEDEDYALRFAVGHEIAHVDLKHALRCLAMPELKKSREGTLKQLYAVILPLGYLPAQDFEADRWAADRMKAIGHSRREILAFLRKFEGHARKEGFENIRPQPKPGVSPIENHARAHPLARKRLGELEAVIPPALKPAR